MWRLSAILVTAAILSACATRERGTTVTTLPASDGQKVVIAESAATPRGEVRHRVTGRVTDIERNSGTVTVRASDGAKVKVLLPPMAAASVREGDDVSLDVIVTPRR
jgi:hypothetical protein